MKRWLVLRWLLAALLVGLMSPAAAAPASSGVVESLPSRQILVMLKVAPAHLHVGANYGAGPPGVYEDSGSWAARRHTAESLARKNGFTLLDGWPMPLLGVDCYVMRVAPGLSVEAAVAKVSHDPLVAWSEPMELYEAKGGIGQSGGRSLLAIQPAAVQWRLTDLHKYASGRGISIAVIDSKIDVRHPELLGHFIADENFLSVNAPRPEEHGTAVAGIIGANGVRIEGIAPGAELMALRACWQVSNVRASPPTLCESLAIARALQFAIEHKAKVINLSLSGPPGLLLSKLISIALARNASVVAAFDPNLPKGGFPASQPGVIAVADETLHNLPGNVYAAPGRDVPTTEPGGKWYLVTGTSYAVAHVSGLIALVRQHRNTASLARTSSGRIDACSSLLGTLPHCDCACGLFETAQGGKR